MDDQDKTPPEALNEEVTEVETVDETPSSETAEEVQPSEESKKKGYSARVRELNQRAREAEEKAQSLSEKLAALTQGVPEGAPQMPTNQPLPPLVKEGEELTYEEINRRQLQRDEELLKRATQVTNLQTQQALAIERINREARELTRKYEELNPQSEAFDRELSDTLTEAAEAYVRANPTKSLEEFVDKQMRLHKRAVSKEVKAEQAEVTRQQGQSAIRPSTAKTAEKKFEDMTIEEMEAKLGYTGP